MDYSRLNTLQANAWETICNTRAALLYSLYNNQPVNAWRDTYHCSSPCLLRVPAVIPQQSIYVAGIL